MCFIYRNKSNEENLNLNIYYEVGEYWRKWWIKAQMEQLTKVNCVYTV